MRGFDFDKALVALQNELHCFAYKLTWIIRISLIPVRILKAGCIPSCAMHLSIIAGQRKYEGIYMYYQNLNIISC